MLAGALPSELSAYAKFVFVRKYDAGWDVAGEVDGYVGPASLTAHA